ncbi:thioredoxin family protein [Amphibacillus sediminis]|uniref:thioredoxin family protein n=1 Tax=Amphibacillus sediminis TaxID=360185 RepID=UPI000833C0FC|nr:thioredoxin family protein [Amphibacillus sediminis]
MKALESEVQFQELANEGKTVFMFSADWCPDCRVIEPFLPELEESYPDLTFIYVDRDQFIDLCIKQDIFGIPSFLAFNNGEEVARFVSKDRKTREEIEAFLDKVG